MAKEKFYKPSVSVDIVVFTIEDSSLKVLTIKRKEQPFKGKTALPGGFLHSDETTYGAAKRILEDKVGLQSDKIYLEQLYTFDKPNRDPRGPVLSVAYFALVPIEEISITSTASAQDPSFTTVKNLERMAFDHNDIVKYAHDRLRGKLEYSNIAFAFLPTKFTFSELQDIYETIFLKKLDKRNFRKKISRLGLVKPTKEKAKKGRQRPALLYKSATDKTQTFKNNF